MAVLTEGFGETAKSFQMSSVNTENLAASSRRHFDDVRMRWHLPEQQRDHFNLLKMALDMLSIPANASNSRRLFSSSNTTVFNRRNRLKLILLRSLSVLITSRRSNAD